MQPYFSVLPMAHCIRVYWGTCSPIDILGDVSIFLIPYKKRRIKEYVAIPLIRVLASSALHLTCDWESKPVAHPIYDWVIKRAIR